MKTGKSPWRLGDVAIDPIVCSKGRTRPSLRTGERVENGNIPGIGDLYNLHGTLYNA